MSTKARPDEITHDIRYTYLTDAAYLKKWISDPYVLRWFPMGTESEIDNAIQCWMGFCRWSSSLTATINHVPCGIATLFLMPYKKVAHQALFKIVVDPAWQRKGLGHSLLRNIKHLAKNYFHLETIQIEVFESNPLFSLLRKEGFYEAVRQEKYIKIDNKYYARFLMEVCL